MPVGRDENLVDLETDKVVLEVPAPAAGVMKEIKVENGATVTSGQVLAILEAGEGAAAATSRERHSRSEDCGSAESKPQAVPRAASSRPRRSAWSKSTSSMPRRSPAAAAMAAQQRRCDSAPRRQGASACRRSPRKQRSRRRGAAAVGGRHAQRAARADDAPARAHRRAPGPGAVDGGDADHVQRSRPDGGQRAPRALQGQVREDARRRSSASCRSSSRRAIEALRTFPGRQRVDRRQRHRLSRVLRHRRRGLDRSRPDGAGAARCRDDELRRDRSRPSVPTRRRRATARSRSKS